MIIPGKLKIGAADYELVWMTAEECPEHLGECDSDEHWIAIRRGMPWHKEATIVLHEVLHACYAAAGLVKPRYPEEEVVTGLSLQLAQVIRDNPHLVAYFAAAFNHGERSAA